MFRVCLVFNLKIISVTRMSVLGGKTVPKLMNVRLKACTTFKFLDYHPVTLEIEVIPFYL